jgi:hypothetical protein
MAPDKSLVAASILAPREDFKMQKTWNSCLLRCDMGGDFWHDRSLFNSEEILKTAILQIVPEII